MNYSVIKIDQSRDFVKRLMWFFLVNLTIIQQMPLIKDIFYNQIRFFLYYGFAFFAGISLQSINKILKINFFRFFILTILYSIVLFFTNKAVKASSVIELFVPFGILACSFNTGFSKKQLENFLLWYVLFSMILGVFSIIYYGQGFKITKNYFFAQKNQLGPLLGISTVITGTWIINKEQYDISVNALIKISTFFLLILSILLIRNRAGFVGVVCTLILFILLEYRIKTTLKKLIAISSICFMIIILLFFGLFNSMKDLLIQSLFSGFDVTDINSISSGRIDVYKLSLKFIRKYPVLGKLEGGSFYYNPHNYILNKWVSFGVLGSSPFVVFYIYLYIFLIIGLCKNRSKQSFSLPLWVLLFSLIVSNFEYTYPYGPGVSQLMLWFLLGQYFRHNLRSIYR